MELRDFMIQPSIDEIDEIVPNVMPPYLQTATDSLEMYRKLKTVYVETYGCQMNSSDSEIVRSILKSSGQYDLLSKINEQSTENLPDVMLLMTCAIREGAESKIWARLDALKAWSQKASHKMTIGVLGCMAERLKDKILDRKRNVQLVCGPDAYRDLPRLLMDAFSGVAGINVMLSADETYADIAPVRVDDLRRSAFVSIMRGCNNMCAYCIVPFTRGRERSRPMQSIIGEVKRLSQEGIREITLLGQNVNSYYDNSFESQQPLQEASISKGFTTIYRTPKRAYLGSFTHLLDQVSLVDSQMRIRFASPHPKDFPDNLLELMRDRPNICKQIHLPAQSGSTFILDQMRRGYSRESYLELVDRIRQIIPNVSLSSDFITGFCGETDDHHRETVSLMENVQYDMAYMFAYSMREKTMAHRRLVDDVPQNVKISRLREICDLFYETASKRLLKTVGNEETVLVEGPSKKSPSDLCGRSDGGSMIVFPNIPIQCKKVGGSQSSRSACPGDYVRVKITHTKGTTPIAEPMHITTI